jgi:hypothetical protein
MNLPLREGHPFAAQTEKVRAGAMPLLEGELRVQWQQPQVSPWLRMALLSVDLMFKEAGAEWARVTRLLDAMPPYNYGIAADVSLGGLPRVSRLCRSDPPPKVAVQICARLNALMPFGDGDRETATANGAEIHIQVPVRGYQSIANCFADWPALGATGITRRLTVNPASLVAPVDVPRIRKFSR